MIRKGLPDEKTGQVSCGQADLFALHTAFSHLQAKSGELNEVDKTSRQQLEKNNLE